MEKIDTSQIEYWPQDVFLGASPIDAELSLDILSREEHQTINGFKNPNRKNEFLSVRYLFRYLLKQAGYEPQEVDLLKEPSGKPYALIKGQKKLFVSFSHSYKRVYCALSEQKDIGLDVEPLEREINPKLLKRILTPAEQENLMHLPTLTLWTIKEAAVKNLGTGLRTNLNELMIQESGDSGFFVDFNDDKRFKICSFTQADHQIALAY